MSCKRSRCFSVPRHREGGHLKVKNRFQSIQSYSTQPRTGSVEISSLDLCDVVRVSRFGLSVTLMCKQGKKSMDLGFGSESGLLHVWKRLWSKETGRISRLSLKIQTAAADVQALIGVCFFLLRLNV